jgi:hypothetical protein
VERDLKDEEKGTQNLLNLAKTEVPIDDKLIEQEKKDMVIGNEEGRENAELKREEIDTENLINQLFNNNFREKDRTINMIEEILKREKAETEKKVSLDDARIRNAEAIRKWIAWKKRREEKLVNWEKRVMTRLERDIGKQGIDQHMLKYRKIAFRIEKKIHDSNSMILGEEGKIKELSKKIKDHCRENQKNIEQQFHLLQEMKFVHDIPKQRSLLENVRSVERKKGLLISDIARKEDEIRRSEAGIIRLMENSKVWHLRLISFLRREEGSEKEMEKVVEETY